MGFCLNITNENCITNAMLAYNGLLCSSLISLVLMGFIFVLIFKHKRLKRLNLKIFIQVLIIYTVIIVMYLIHGIVFQARGITRSQVMTFWTLYSFGLFRDSCQLEGYISYFIYTSFKIWLIIWMYDLNCSFNNMRINIATRTYFIYALIGYGFPLFLTLFLKLLDFLIDFKMMSRVIIV